MKGLHIYTGEGGGKTVAALGLALRAVGHGHKVIIIQFMKGRRYIGEYKIARRLYPEYNIYQFGREEFVDLKNPSDEDKKIAEEGLKFVKRIVKKEKPDILILDEINLAASINLISIEDVIDLLNKIPEKTLVVFTGRRAPKEFIEKADMVTELIPIKHPYEKGIKARTGIEY